MKRPVLIPLLIAVIFFTSLASFIPAKTDSLVDDVLVQTNKFRKSQGLPPLVMNEELNAIAQKHSADMASGRVEFGHDGFEKRENMAKKQIEGIGSFAENVAFGVNTGKEVVDLWKNSPGHRRNMLGNYKYIGIGVASDKKGRIYYTQVFAD